MGQRYHDRLELGARIPDAEALDAHAAQPAQGPRLCPFAMPVARLSVGKGALGIPLPGEHLARVAQDLGALSPAVVLVPAGVSEQTRLQRFAHLEGEALVITPPLQHPQQPHQIDLVAQLAPLDGLNRTQ